MNDIQLDKVDLDILRELQRDSRLSVRELAARVHRSATPVFERLRRLESQGVIKGYTVNIDLEKIGRDFIVFCNVKLRRINTEIHERFAAEVAAMPEVTECYNVSGAVDYMLKVQVPDMKAYREFVTARLGGLDMHESVQSVFVMETIKHDVVPM
ncbi:MAG: Lrp/AsnC family transcriptional regulator [Muribaculaceae bacterium]|jgi:Lrp/AsnC family leucine-responsive transcriptional regulator|nr:Lrp/AsnC family transcriptional regulator [Muribaculaceae bacterium]